MDTTTIRHLIELASRAPMSSYERHNFNRDAPVWLAHCDQIEARARRAMEGAEKATTEKGGDAMTKAESQQSGDPQA